LVITTGRPVGNVVRELGVGEQTPVLCGPHPAVVEVGVQGSRRTTRPSRRPCSTWLTRSAIGQISPARQVHDSRWYELTVGPRSRLRRLECRRYEARLHPGGELPRMASPGKRCLRTGVVQRAATSYGSSHRQDGRQRPPARATTPVGIILGLGTIVEIWFPGPRLVRLCGLLEDSRRAGVWPDSVQVPDWFALFWAAHSFAGVAHFRSAARRAP
jgi:hypothetical protein